MKLQPINDNDNTSTTPRGANMNENITKARTLFSSAAMSDELRDFIDRADQLRHDANAAEDQHHASQQPGRLYFDATAMLKNLLAHAYGADAGRVYQGMLESGDDHTHVATFLAKIDVQEQDAAFEVVAEDYDESTARFLSENYPKALPLIAEGWTMDNALDHVQGMCDHEVCTGDHEEQGR